MLPGRTMAVGDRGRALRVPAHRCGAAARGAPRAAGLVIGIAAGLNHAARSRRCSGSDFVSPAGARPAAGPGVGARGARRRPRRRASGAVTVQSRRSLILPTGLLSVAAAASAAALLPGRRHRHDHRDRGRGGRARASSGGSSPGRLDVPSMVIVVPASFALLPGLTIFRGLYELVAVAASAGSLSMQSGSRRCSAPALCCWRSRPGRCSARSSRRRGTGRSAARRPGGGRGGSREGRRGRYGGGGREGISAAPRRLRGCPRRAGRAAGVAQSVAHLSCKQGVEGSSPFASSTSSCSKPLSRAAIERPAALAVGPGGRGVMTCRLVSSIPGMEGPRVVELAEVMHRARPVAHRASPIWSKRHGCELDVLRSPVCAGIPWIPASRDERSRTGGRRRDTPPVVRDEGVWAWTRRTPRTSRAAAGPSALTLTGSGARPARPPCLRQRRSTARDASRRHGLGEALEVEQLTPRHDEVTDRPGHPEPGRLHDDLEEEARSLRPPRARGRTTGRRPGSSR